MARKKKEDDPTMKSAEAISESVFGHSLAKKQKEKAGPLVHYAFGTLMGGVYGLAAEVSPTVKSVGGLPFGAALFLGADEIALPVLNLTKGPSRVPAFAASFWPQFAFRLGRDNRLGSPHRFARHLKNGINLRSAYENLGDECLVFNLGNLVGRFPCLSVPATGT